MLSFLLDAIFPLPQLDYLFQLWVNSLLSLFPWKSSEQHFFLSQLCDVNQAERQQFTQGQPMSIMVSKYLNLYFPYFTPLNCTLIPDKEYHRTNPACVSTCMQGERERAQMFRQLKGFWKSWFIWVSRCTFCNAFHLACVCAINFVLQAALDISSATSFS